MPLAWFCACLQKAKTFKTNNPLTKVRKTTLAQPFDSTSPSQLAQLTCWSQWALNLLHTPERSLIEKYCLLKANPFTFLFLFFTGPNAAFTGVACWRDFLRVFAKSATVCGVRCNALLCALFIQLKYICLCPFDLCNAQNLFCKLFYILFLHC